MPKAIDFENPPIVEVVCGAAFGPLNAMKAPHYGAFWKTLPKEFDRVEEVPPILYPDEPHLFMVSDVPPLPRVWFIAKGDQQLIQLQRDRFLYNWKRPDPEGEYPEFENIFPEFLRFLGQFRDFILNEGLGAVEFRQFELTYVNHIPVKSIEGLLECVSDVIADHVRDSSRERFLPKPGGYKWMTSYQLPDEMGQLHVTAQNARKKDDDEEILRLDLSARGVGNDTSDEGMKAWFGVAHDWIVHGFADLTNEKIQDEIWGRKR